MKIQFSEEELREAICNHVNKIGISTPVSKDNITFSMSRNPTAISVEIELGASEASVSSKETNEVTSISVAKKGVVLEEAEEIVDEIETTGVPQTEESLFGS